MAHRIAVLHDELWEVVEPLLPRVGAARRARPRVAARTAFGAISAVCDANS